ncbi:MAG: TRAP transporter small permease [Firmicutes bacterium]|nr:TRAP transporter small permease [Bacillota bacterium]
MKRFKTIVFKASRHIDILAGFILVGVAVLIVANIVLRRVANSSILGTYEMVGYLTAAAIGLSIAYCAVQKGHISANFLIERLPRPVQRIINIFVDLASFVFLSMASWHLARYATSIALSGRVSPTIRFPFYPFVYLVALGFLALALVMLVRLAESMAGGGKEP